MSPAHVAHDSSPPDGATDADATTTTTTAASATSGHVDPAAPYPPAAVPAVPHVPAATAAQDGTTRSHESATAPNDAAIIATTVRRPATPTIHNGPVRRATEEARQANLGSKAPDFPPVFSSGLQ